MQGYPDHPNQGRKDQDQATIIARVAYVLLHTFVLSTVFRCKADVQGNWLSHVASAGFAVLVLLSTALYIALTFMDPGYIPTIDGLKLQEENQEELIARQAGGGNGIHMTGSSAASSSSQGLAEAPAFDLEGLLHGAAQLPSTHSLAPRALLGGAKQADEVAADSSAAATEEPSASPNPNPKHQWAAGNTLPYSKAARHTACKFDALPGVSGPDSRAGQLISALHGPASLAACDSESGPGSRECAWWEKSGLPGRRCEWCGAFQRLRAHHCATCKRCVDTHDHHCAWLGTCIGVRNQSMYLGFLVAQIASCTWAAQATLPCLANPRPMLPWHTVFGVDWRVAATLLLLLGLLLPYLAYLLVQQLYLAATAQTARECYRRNQVPYLMHVNRRVHPFSRGCLRNLWEYVAWRPERHWELPSTEELLNRQMHAGRGCGLC